jgi:hypothetical protein
MMRAREGGETDRTFEGIGGVVKGVHKKNACKRWVFWSPEWAETRRNLGAGGAGSHAAGSYLVLIHA